MDKKKRAIALGLASTMLASMTSVVSYAGDVEDPVGEKITINSASKATVNQEDFKDDETAKNWVANNKSVDSVELNTDAKIITVKAKLGDMKNAFADTEGEYSEGRGKAFPIVVTLSKAASENYIINYSDDHTTPSGTNGDRVKAAYLFDGDEGTTIETYDNNKCVIWLSEEWTGDGHKIRFGENGDDYTVKVVDVTEYNVSATTTNGDSDNYTASVSASSKVKVGDTVTITVAPKGNYSFKDTAPTITKPTVEGVVFANSDEDGTYTADVTITDAMVKDISDGNLAFTVNGTVKKYVTLTLDKTGLKPATGSDLENEVEVTLKDSEGNAVTDETKLFAGDKLTLTVKPKAGFKFSAEEDKALTVKLGETPVDGEGGVYTVDISNVSSALTLTVAGELAKDSTNYNVTLPTSDKYTVVGKYTVDGEEVNNLSAVPAGTKVTLTVTAKEGYKLVSAKLGEGEPVNAENDTVTLQYVVNGADATNCTITLPALTVATKKIITPAFSEVNDPVALEMIESAYGADTVKTGIISAANTALGASVTGLEETDYTLTAADSVTDGKVKVTFALTDEGKTKYELSGEAPTVDVPVKFWNEYTVSTGTAPAHTTVTAKVGDKEIGGGKVHKNGVVTVEVKGADGYVIKAAPTASAPSGVSFTGGETSGVWTASYTVLGSEDGDTINFTITATALKILDTPSASDLKINFADETIAPKTEDNTLKFYSDKECSSEITANSTNVTPGATIYLKNVAQGEDTADSEVFEYKLPARPTAPTGLSSTQIAEGKSTIKGLKAGMEYGKVEESLVKSWTKVNEDGGVEVDATKNDKYQIRTAATATDFSSEVTEITLSDEATVAGTVSVANPANATYNGKEQTGKATITIQNTGNSTGTFTLTPTTVEIADADKTVEIPAGRSKDVTVTIKGTNAGTYVGSVAVTAVVKATEEATAETKAVGTDIGTANVSFTIEKAAQSITIAADNITDFVAGTPRDVTVTISGIKESAIQSVTVTGPDGKKVAFSENKFSAKVAGTYTISVTTSETTNYKAVTTPVTKTVTVSVKSTNTKPSGGNGGGGSSSGGGSGSSSGGSSSSGSSSTATTPAEVASDVSSAKKGDTVSSNGVTELPASTVKAAADKGVVLEAKVDSTFTWNVDTANLTNKNADLKLGITTQTVTKTTIDKNVVGLDSKPVTKTIGFTTQTGDKSKSEKLVIATGDKSTTTETKYATLFKKNADGTLTAVSAAVIGKDGKATLPIKEAGSYVLVTSTETKLIGDLDNDCVINAMDAVNELKGLVAGTMNSKKTPKGDFNGDGYVNALDAVTILKSIVAGE